MKRIVGYIVLGMFVCSMASCWTKQAIVVNGTPGTKIYDADLTERGTIGENGRVRIKLERDYYPFLLSRDSRTGNYYPFGLDFKYCIRTTTLGTLWMYILPPLLFIVYPFSTTEQSFDGFRYLEEQYIDPYPDAAYANTGERREVKSGGVVTSAQLSKEETLSATSKLLRKDYAEQLEGSYVGSGKLLRKEVTVETYNNMKILMRRVDRHTVSVEVLLEGEESVLDPCNYRVDHQGNSDFVLVSGNSASSEIRIKNNKVTYVNSNVNIEGEVYKLQITASSVKKLLSKSKK